MNIYKLINKPTTQYCGVQRELEEISLLLDIDRKEVYYIFSKAKEKLKQYFSLSGINPDRISDLFDLIDEDSYNKEIELKVTGAHNQSKIFNF